MNNVSLIGRLTADPELKHTQSGIPYTRFNIAVDRKYVKDQERQTDFISIQAWNGTAEFVSKYFFKGMKIGITGSIRVGQYTDKDGNKRNTFDIIANDVEFVEKKQNTYNSSAPDEEDLPY